MKRCLHFSRPFPPIPFLLSYTSSHSNDRCCNQFHQYSAQPQQKKETVVYVVAENKQDCPYWACKHRKNVPHKFEIFRKSFLFSGSLLLHTVALLIVLLVHWAVLSRPTVTLLYNNAERTKIPNLTEIGATHQGTSLLIGDQININHNHTSTKHPLIFPIEMSGCLMWGCGLRGPRLTRFILAKGDS